MKSAEITDYDDYLQVHAQNFRVPDKPDVSPSHTSKKMFSKINSLTRQLTGTSLDTPDETPPTLLAHESNNGDIPKSDSSHSLGKLSPS